MLLAGCGGVHPGSAAVLDGNSITIKTVDDDAQSYCNYALVVAKQSGVKDIATGDARKQALSGLITADVADKIAEEKGIVVAPKDYKLTPQEIASIEGAFPAKGLEGVKAIIEQSKKTSLIATRLGEQELTVTADATNTEQVDAAGNKVIQDAIAASSLTIDPRFGLNKKTLEGTSGGSLSVAEVSDADVDPADLHIGQRCS